MWSAHRGSGGRFSICGNEGNSAAYPERNVCDSRLTDMLISLTLVHRKPPNACLGDKYADLTETVIVNSGRNVVEDQCPSAFI